MSVSLDAYVVKTASIAASTSGDNVVVNAVTGKQIWVLRCVLISNGSVDVKFKSGTGLDITGPFYLVANTGFAIAQSEGQYVAPWFRTSASQSLVLNLSTSVSVGGVLNYIEVDGADISSSSSSRSSSSSSSSSSCRSSSSSSRSSSSSSRSSSSSSRSSSSSSANP